MNQHINQIEAHTQAVKTQQREDLEDAVQLTAVPGCQVVVIRKPWQVGRVGTVIGVLNHTHRPRALIDFDGKFDLLPLDAIARREGAIDCARAQIRHKTAWIKFAGSEFGL